MLLTLLWNKQWKFKHHCLNSHLKNPGPRGPTLPLKEPLVGIKAAPLLQWSSYPTVKELQQTSFHIISYFGSKDALDHHFYSPRFSFLLFWSGSSNTHQYAFLSQPKAVMRQFELFGFIIILSFLLFSSQWKPCDQRLTDYSLIAMISQGYYHYAFR